MGMKKLISLMALALVFAAATVAHANGELDNEEQIKNAQRMAKDLPQTLVVKKDALGNVSVLHSKELLADGAQIDESKFIDLKNADGKRGELDGDSSASGWYFYWNYYYNYSYPTYYYGNYYYNYQPYYNYYYNNCWYSWYRWY
jgi:hypothetical protein